MQLGKLVAGQHSLTQAVQEMEQTSAVSRKQLYEKIETIGHDLAEQGHRLANLEKSMAKAEPDLAEFRALKQQAKGAGMLWKFLWAAGGALIAAGGWLIATAQGWVK